MKSPKLFFLCCLLSSFFGCSSAPDKTEVAQSISSEMGVNASDINQISTCFFSIPASKTSRKGDWFPCVVAETNDSVSVLSGGALMFTAKFADVEWIGFPASRSNHEVQIAKEDSLISFQILKQFDLVDDEAGKALFDRMKSTGIIVNEDAVRIIHGH